MDTRKIGLKNFGVHAIVELILGILLPYGLTGLTALIATRTGNIVNMANIIILLVLFLLVIMDEYFISKITLKITKNNYLISKFMLGFTLLKILFPVLNIIKNTDSDYVFTIICTLLFIFLKMSSYFIAKKSVLKANK